MQRNRHFMFKYSELVSIPNLLVLHVFIINNFKAKNHKV